MPVTYKKAPTDAQLLMEAVRDEFHPDLVEAAARIGLMFAFGPRNEETGELTGPALKVHGTTAAGECRLNSLRHRAEGKPDATITIDGDQWPEWSESRRRSLLDHELYHLIVQRAQSGAILTDDLGRPKFKMRQHDFEVGWFQIIAERHGEASFEVEQAALLVDERGQILWPWAPSAPADDSEGNDREATISMRREMRRKQGQDVAATASSFV